MSNTPTRCKQNFCFAPGCRTGYAGAPKASLFSAPKDAELRKQWELNLRRLDSPLTERSAVCERHFEPQLILRDYVHVINGAEVRIPRGKPSLAPGAVPTLLPDLPGYLSKKLAKPRATKGRQSTTETDSPPSKKPNKTYGEPMNFRSSPSRRFLAESTSQNARSSQPTVVHLRTYERKQSVVETRQEDVVVATCDDTPKIVEDGPLTIESLKRNLVLPSQEWCRIHTLETVRVVFVTSVIKNSGDRIEISHPKCVSFSTVEGPEVVAEAFFDGALCCRAIVTSLKEAEAIIQDANTTHTCKGAMSAAEFAEVSEVISTRCMEKMGKNEEDTVFSLECARNVAAEGAICTPCKTLRKLLLNRKSRVKTLAIRRSTRNKGQEESPPKREESTERSEVEELKTSQLQESAEQSVAEQLVSLHIHVGSEQFVEVRDQESLQVEESPEQFVAEVVEVPLGSQESQQTPENQQAPESQQMPESQQAPESQQTSESLQSQDSRQECTDQQGRAQLEQSPCPVSAQSNGPS